MVVRWEHFLVHPVGVAPKVPSSFLKLLGFLYCFKAFDFALLIFHWGHFLVHPVGVAPKAPSDFCWSYPEAYVLDCVLNYFSCARRLANLALLL